MKKVALLLVVLAVVVMGVMAFAADPAKAPAAPAAKPAAAPAAKTYSATIYVAGKGGHYTKAEVTLNPANANEPVKIIGSMDRISINPSGVDGKQYATHDARIDVNDPNVMFWSTYVPDANKKMHVGKSDLKTGKVIMDVAHLPCNRNSDLTPEQGLDHPSSGRTDPSGVAGYLALLAGSNPRAFEASSVVLLPFVVYATAALIGALFLVKFWRHMPVKGPTVVEGEGPVQVMSPEMKEHVSHERPALDKVA